MEVRYFLLLSLFKNYKGSEYMEALADELLKGKKKERNNATDDWNEYQRQWREKNKLSYHETQARYHLKKVRALREEESLLYEK